MAKPRTCNSCLYCRKQDDAMRPPRRAPGKKVAGWCSNYAANSIWRTWVMPDNTCEHYAAAGAKAPLWIRLATKAIRMVMGAK